MFAKERQHLFAYQSGYPRINPVRDDVVELAEFGAELHDITVAQINIPELYQRGQGASLLNRAAAQVDSNELALWPLIRDRNEVRPITAAEFEYAAMRQGSR